PDNALRRQNLHSGTPARVSGARYGSELGRHFFPAKLPVRGRTVYDEVVKGRSPSHRAGWWSRIYLKVHWCNQVSEEAVRYSSVGKRPRFQAQSKASANKARSLHSGKKLSWNHTATNRPSSHACLFYSFAF